MTRGSGRCRSESEALGDEWEWGCVQRREGVVDVVKSVSGGEGRGRKGKTRSGESVEVRSGAEVGEGGRG